MNFRTSLLALACTLLISSQAAQAGPAFLTDARIDTLKKRVSDKVEPNYSAWLVVLNAADKALADSPPVIPPTYHSLSPYKYPGKSQELQASNTFGRDARAAYRLALAYRITGDEKYAAAAARLIGAWSTQLKSFESKTSNTALSVSSVIPLFIIAADLLKQSPSFPPSEQARFKKFLREVVLPSKSAELCMKRKNNWANFGVILALTAGTYLPDQSLYATGIRRWKELIDSQMDAEGILNEEVNRKGGPDNAPGGMGIWYTNFGLMSSTFGAEVARVNGVNLYDYVSPNGKSLRKAFERAIPWLKDPATFPYYKGSGDPTKLTGIGLVPYFEMLLPRWPNADASAILQALRPVRNNHSIPDATFTHGDLPLDR